MSQIAVMEKKNSHLVDQSALLTRDMDAAAASRLSALLAKNLRRVQVGADIVAEGEDAPTILLVLEGWVALNKSLQNGQIQTIDLFLASDIILPTSGDALVSAYDVHALTDVVVSSISRVELDDLEISDPPKMWSAVRTHEARARARVAERTLRLGQASAETRLAYALIELCLRLEGAQHIPKDAFDLPLTQQQIGEYSGLSSVHVCRTLRRLSRQGLIDTSENNRVVITDIQGLAGIADAELDVLRSELLAPDV